MEHKSKIGSFNRSGLIVISHWINGIQENCVLEGETKEEKSLWMKLNLERNLSNELIFKEKSVEGLLSLRCRFYWATSIKSMFHWETRANATTWKAELAWKLEFKWTRGRLHWHKYYNWKSVHELLHVTHSAGIVENVSRNSGES